MIGSSDWVIGGKDAEARREDEKTALPVRSAWLEDNQRRTLHAHTARHTARTHSKRTHGKHTHSKPHSTLYTLNAPPSTLFTPHTPHTLNKTSVG